MDAVDLARLQFFFTISFHIIFPGFTIGLSALIATLDILEIRTGREHYLRLARFWTRIFAVSFAMGVVSGIVLSYQFGTNWSRFSEVTGNVIGPLIGYEVLTAFFLEATFLGVLLFGSNRVPRWLHATSAIIVAVGTCMSAFWILSANSWMHTPTGYEMRGGIAWPVDWSQIIFNPSFPYRLAHMLTAAYLTTALVVLAAGARWLLADRFATEAHSLLHLGLLAIAVLAPLQLFIGDQHGLNTAKYQPVKLAAMEGHWEGGHPAGLVLFAWPDMQAERNLAAVSVPNLASLIITHDPQGLFPGLKDFPRADRPNVPRVFFAFRAMVGIGLVILALAATGVLLWWRKRLFDTRWYLWIAGHCWPLGFVAILCGWIVTESGRQPWVAWHILRTADAVSNVSAGSIAVSLALFVVVYCVVFGVGAWYIRRLIRIGPAPAAVAPPDGPANRPLAAAQLK
jgi:cytochrome d ubiquinol oxidase subunit I